MLQTKDNLSKRQFGLWTAVILLLYLALNLGNLLSEFWYDEVLTLTNFGVSSRHNGLWECVFRSYPIANNHILNSAISYFCQKIFPIDSEPLQRLPSLLFGGCSILVVTCVWRKVLGDKMALFGGCLVAASPIINAYVWQLRGYSLTLFLSTLATTGVLFADKAPRRSLALSSISCLLLPLVIPSNAMIAPVIGVAFAFKRKTWKQRLLSLFCIGFSTAVGLSYYLTIWPQFVKAMQEPDGYRSISKVVLELGFGLCYHLLPLTFLFYTCKTSDRDSLAQLGIIAGGSFLISGAILLLSRSGHAPYPRIFLVFFPPLTAVALLALRNTSFSLFYGCAVCIAIGLVLTQINMHVTKKLLADGYVPDTFLFQYYQGSTEMREAAFYLTRRVPKETLVITDPYDFPTMAFYWALTGHDARFVNPIDHLPATPRIHPILVVARTEKDFQEICKVARLAPERATVLKASLLRTFHFFDPQVQNSVLTTELDQKIK